MEVLRAEMSGCLGVEQSPSRSSREPFHRHHATDSPTLRVNWLRSNTWRLRVSPHSMRVRAWTVPTLAGKLSRSRWYILSSLASWLVHSHGLKPQVGSIAVGDVRTESRNGAICFYLAPRNTAASSDCSVWLYAIKGVWADVVVCPLRTWLARIHEPFGRKASTRLRGNG